jgi:hypothetical protein
MAMRRGNGVLAWWCDVDAPLRDTFMASLTGHLDLLGSVAGVLDTGVYAAVSGGPHYIVVVELRDHFVFQTDAFQRAWYGRQGDDRHWSDLARNYLRNLYRQIFPTRIDPIMLDREMPPFLSIGRMAVAPIQEEEFNAWYNAVHLPLHVAVPGCSGGRRFAVVDGQPKYMTIYDVEDGDIRDSAAWQAASTNEAWSLRLRPLQHDEGSPGVYRRIFPTPAG